MSKISFTISKKELSKFSKTVDLFDANMMAKTKKALQYAALEGKSVAIINSPVRYGVLKNSNHYRTTNNGFGIKLFNNAEYAEYVEFGTSRMKAQPFFGKGFYAAIKKLKKVLQS